MSLYLNTLETPYHGVFFLFLAVLQECSDSTSSMNFPSKESIFLLHYPFDLFSRLKLLGKKEHAFKAI